LSTWTRSHVDVIGEGHRIQVQKLDNLTEVVDRHTRKIDDLSTAVLALRTDVTELRTGQDELRTGQDELRTTVAGLKADVADLRTGQDELNVGLDQVRAGQEQMRCDMNRGFKELSSQISLSYSELDGRLRPTSPDADGDPPRLRRLPALPLQFQSSCLRLHA